jgi:hypothetical protein
MFPRPAEGPGIGSWAVDVVVVRGQSWARPLIPSALVEAGHAGAPVAQRREQGAGATAGVEDPSACHVPGQGQHRGPLVIGIDEVG